MLLYYSHSDISNIFFHQVWWKYAVYAWGLSRGDNMISLEWIKKADAVFQDEGKDHVLVFLVCAVWNAAFKISVSWSCVSEVTGKLWDPTTQRSSRSKERLAMLASVFLFIWRNWIALYFLLLKVSTCSLPFN